MTALAPSLTDGERDVLAINEQVIEHGLGTFMEVGRALARIRDSRLYREQHATFEAYCEQRWQISRPRAYELMRAAEIVGAVSAMADTPVPTSERQARELTGLDPATAAEVMRKAHEDSDGKVTAAAIRDARNDVAPKPQPQRPASHACAICDELFTSPVRHCGGCGGHYQPGVACPSCEATVNTSTGEIGDASPTTEPSPAKPRYEPEPPTASPEAKARRDRLVSNQAWSNNLAANVNWFARLAPAAYRAHEFRDQFIPEYAAAHGGVTRDLLLDAARFITALADVWGDDLKETA